MNKENRNYFHIYIASCMTDGGIYHYRFDNEQIRFIDKIDCDRPMYLAIKDHRLYALLRQPFCDSNHSGVISWEIDCNGNLLSPNPLLNTLGDCACHLSVEQHKIYVANYLSSSVSKLPDGIVKMHHGCSLHPQRQTAPHPHCIIPTPDEKYYAVADLGIDSVIIYDKDLNVISSAKVPEGQGARHLCFSEDGKYLFCANELASTVSAFSYYNGKLSFLSTYPVLPEAFKGESTIAAIRISGNTLYVSNRGHDSIASYTIDRDGLLKVQDYTLTGGASPRDFNIYSNWLFCANELTDNVTCFKRNGAQLVNAELDLQIPKPLSIVFY